MTIKTQNSLYKLEDQGDGAFLISGNNRHYATDVPYLCRLFGEPRVGERMFVCPINGFRAGRSWSTSIVVEIES